MFKQESKFPIDELFEESKVKISIYQPSTRSNLTSKENKIRFKNLVAKTKESLLLEYQKKEVDTILKPLYEIEEDLTFWNESFKGIGILMTENNGYIYKLNRNVPEIAIVSKNFYIKPLLRNYQSIDSFYVLGLSKKNFSLYKGSRYEVNELINSKDVNMTRDDVIGTSQDSKVIKSSSMGGSNHPKPNTYHTVDEIDVKETENYFRAVDKFIQEYIGQNDKSPIIIVSIAKNQGIFRSISQNPNYIKDSIIKSYEDMKIDELHKEMWTVLEPIFLEKTKVLMEEFKNKEVENKASTNLDQIIEEAIKGTIEKLVIDAEKIIPGKIDYEKAAVIEKSLIDPNTGDILNDLAEIVLSKKGEIIVLPSAKMPKDSGCIGIYRY